MRESKVELPWHLRSKPQKSERQRRSRLPYKAIAASAVLLAVCYMMWPAAPQMPSNQPPPVVAPPISPEHASLVEPGPAAVPRPRGKAPFALGRSALAKATNPEVVAGLTKNDLYVIDDMVSDALSNMAQSDFHYSRLPYPEGLTTVTLKSSTISGSRRCVPITITAAWRSNVTVVFDEACNSGSGWALAPSTKTKR